MKKFYKLGVRYVRLHYVYTPLQYTAIVSAVTDNCHMNYICDSFSFFFCPKHELWALVFEYQQSMF